MVELTPRQKSVLEYMITFQERHGMAPTVREIMNHLGLSAPAGIHRILHVLKEKGYLTAEAGKKRSWRLNKPAWVRGIPLIGKIAAGAPLEAVEYFEEELAVSPEMFGCETCYGLRVQGDSMIDAHILDGDLAIIRPQPKVASGDIAAVMVEDMLTEATLKIVRYTQTGMFLEPANKAYDRMVFYGPQRKWVTVLGKFMGIVRRT